MQLSKHAVTLFVLKSFTVSWEKETEEHVFHLVVLFYEMTTHSYRIEFFFLYPSFFRFSPCISQQKKVSHSL